MGRGAFLLLLEIARQYVEEIIVGSKMMQSNRSYFDECY